MGGIKQINVILNVLYVYAWDTQDRCWKKNGKGPSTSTNFLKLLVNDEETNLTEFN
jgi:hypothetical protein